MNYLGLDVQIHGLGRWGTALTVNDVTERVLTALRAAFPEHEYDSDIIVNVEESA